MSAGRLANGDSFLSISGESLEEVGTMMHELSWRRTLAMALGAGLLVAVPAHAHEDPPGCFETGPAIVVSVFRADGVTGVVGNVSECETINYRATLQKASDLDSICAFAEGTFSITTPDGVVHIV